MGRGVRAILTAAWFALAAAAAAQAPDLGGWWGGEVEYRGERTAFYLNLTGAGQPQARFSAPVARLHETAVGPYRVEGTSLHVPGLGWTLAIGNGGRTLEGTLPEALVPNQRLALRLERVAAPPPPAVIVAARAPPTPLWQATVDAEIWAGLALDPAGRRLYVAADNGRVTAFSAATGARAWTVDLGAPIRATPTWHRGRLYVATDAALRAIDARTGASRWTAPFGAPLAARLPISDPHSQWDHYSASAAIAGGLAVVAARDGCVHAFSLSDGQRRWRTCTGRLLTGTPAIAGGRVFFGGYDGRAYALSLADGAEVWGHDSGAPIPRDAVVAGANILFGSRTYELLALDRATGRPAWADYFWYSWVDSPPVVAGGAMFVGSSDALMLRALDVPSGRRLWTSPLPGWSWARPAVGTGSVYAAVSGSRSYIGPRDAAFVAIDRATGALRWMFRPEQPTDRAPFGFAAAPAVGGGRVFAADLTGRVYAFREE